MDVAIIARAEERILRRRLPLMVAILVHMIRCESLIRTLLFSAFSELWPKVASSPYGLGRSEELLATFSRGAFSA